MDHLPRHSSSRLPPYAQLPTTYNAAGAVHRCLCCQFHHLLTPPLPTPPRRHRLYGFVAAVTYSTYLYLPVYTFFCCWRRDLPGYALPACLPYYPYTGGLPLYLYGTVGLTIVRLDPVWYIRMDISSRTVVDEWTFSYLSFSMDIYPLLARFAAHNYRAFCARCAARHAHTRTRAVTGAFCAFFTRCRRTRTPALLRDHLRTLHAPRIRAFVTHLPAGNGAWFGDRRQVCLVGRGPLRWTDDQTLSWLAHTRTHRYRLR